jgi:hypothetical protein
LFAVYPTRRQVPRAVAVLIEVVESSLHELLAGKRVGEGECIESKIQPKRRRVGS